MTKILKYLGKNKWKAVAGLLFKLIAAVAEIVIPLIMADTVNTGTAHLLRNTVLILGIVTANYGFDLLCQYLSADVSASLGLTLRSALFTKIGTFSHAETDKFGASSLITRTTTDVRETQQAVNMGIRLLSRAPFMALGGFAVALTINPKVSLIFLAVTVVVLVTAFIIRKYTLNRYLETQRQLDTVTNGVKEALEGTRVTRAFNLQKAKTAEFDEASGSYMKSVIAVNKISALLNPISYLIINVGIVAVVLLGSRLVPLGMPLSDLTALTTYLLQIMLAMNILSHLIVVFTRAEASAKRVNAVLATEPSITDPTANVGATLGADTPSCRPSPDTDTNNVGATLCRPSPDTDTPIIFDDVDFCYADSSRPSLKNINLRIKKGEHLGIIGGTGSGKSTLINMLPRFYDVTRGRVCVEGLDVREQGLVKLRETVSFAPQKVSIISGTVAENIRIGKPNATDEEVRKASEIACATEFIDRLANGFDSHIEQEGRNLSGGQRQRISLARAFVRRSPILIIDDALSALDVTTDLKVRQNIRREFPDTTLIIVSQRVSSLASCDRIVVIENGEITAIGSHTELLKSSQIYAETAGLEA